MYREEREARIDKKSVVIVLYLNIDRFVVYFTNQTH